MKIFIILFFILLSQEAKPYELSFTDDIEIVSKSSNGHVLTGSIDYIKTRPSLLSNRIKLGVQFYPDAKKLFIVVYSNISKKINQVRVKTNESSKNHTPHYKKAFYETDNLGYGARDMKFEISFGDFKEIVVSDQTIFKIVTNKENLPFSYSAGCGESKKYSDKNYLNSACDSFGNFADKYHKDLSP